MSPVLPPRCRPRLWPLLPVLALPMLVLSGTVARAADWPAYLHDNSRSGLTAEPLPLPLGRLWVHRAAHAPAPAWPAPAHQDFWQRIPVLDPRVTYDRAYQPVVAGGLLYYGSSADDQVTCLDAASGARRWTFFAEAPVRLAPCLAGDRLYFAADDGAVYCLEAATGRLVWKRVLVEGARWLPGNGRLISGCPCRTGVAVAGDVVYASAGLFADTGVYICALDARTGRELWRQKGNLSPQGYLLVSPTRLFTPTGRSTPALFSLADGSPLGSLGGLGGTYAVLTGETLTHSSGRETTTLSATAPGTRERIATFDGLHLIADGDTSYLQGHTSLQALDRARYNEVLASERKLGADKTQLSAELTAAQTRNDMAAVTAARQRLAAIEGQLADLPARKASCWLWQVPCSLPVALIKAGGVLVAGGEGAVAAYDCRSGAVVWQAAVEGRAAGLAVADGRLYVSTETGCLYAFGAGGAPVPAPAPRAEQTSAAVSPASPPAPFARPANDRLPAGLVGRWVCDPAHLQDGRLTDLAGSHDATVTGTVRTEPAPGALVLAGPDTQVSLGEVKDGASLPQNALTVEAWVRVDQITRWGGVLSALQDNGTFEKGFHLGMDQDHFRFAICSRGADDGDGKIRYLDAPRALQVGEWYHVVGTYDGAEQRIYLNGELQASARDQSGPLLYPPRVAYTLGAYRDDDEFLPTVGALAEVRVYDRALTRQEVRASFVSYAGLSPQPLRLAAGPYAQYLSSGSVRLQWRTAAVAACTVRYRAADGSWRTAPPTPAGTAHECLLSGLSPGTEYQYQVRCAAGGRNEETAVLTLETTELPDLQPVTAQASPWPSDTAAAPYLAAARRVVADTGASRGYCFVLGSAGGRLGYELARLTRLQIVCLEPDAQQAAQARALLARAGVYGTRVTVHCAGPERYAPYLANLVVCPEPRRWLSTAAEARAVLALLRPCGGKAYLGSLRLPGQAALTPAQLQGLLTPVLDRTAYTCASGGEAPWASRLLVTRGALAGGGRWTQTYADPGNSASTGDSRLGGALALQWFGRPGPRFMVDRHHRTVPPLVADGRLIIPASNRLLAVDAYNGTQLWDVGLAESRRVCGPRTTSHLALDDRYVYAAASDQCWLLDPDTGAPRRLLPAPQLDAEERHEWGYLAAVGGRVLGTGARPGALRREMNRSAIAETYYDDRPLQTSDYLFCLDPATGRREWTFRRGVIIDTTIAIAAGRLYLIAVPTSPALEDSIGRTPLETLCRGGADLVCLDLRTGEELYRRPVDTSHWRNVLWTACADGILVATGSCNREGRAWYYLTAFDAATGRELWQADHPNNRPGLGGGHGEQDHHPVLSGGVVYAEPVAYDLRTGRRVNPLGAEGAWETPLRGGCGTMSGAAGALFYRDGNPTRYRLGPGGGPAKLNYVSRPGCWINIIAAGGLVVIPEASSGCTCGYPLQASMAFAPVEGTAD